jgi:hypothetical protein
VVHNEGGMIFKNWVPGKAYGPKGEKVTEEWRRLHNEEL